MQNTITERTIAGIFKAAGNGTKAYSLAHGVVTYAGHRPDKDGGTLLFLSPAGLLEYDAAGRLKGHGKDVDIYPSEHLAGSASAWTVLFNMAALHGRILSTEVSDRDSFCLFRSRNASYYAWVLKRSAEKPSSIEGRLMRAFTDSMERKLAEGEAAYPAPERHFTKKTRRRTTV